jgi:hypothetical protein
MGAAFQNTVTVPAGASVQLLQANEKRTALIISAGPTNRFTLSFGQDAVLDSGITVFPATRPLQLRQCDYGCAVKKQIFAISAAADQAVTFVEVLSDELRS